MRGKAFYDMLSKVNTSKSECSRPEDKERIFAAVQELDGGFISVGRREDFECKMMGALGTLFVDKGEYDLALPLLEECLSKCM